MKNKEDIRIIENGLMVGFNNRTYILKDIQFSAYQLKANIKAFLSDDNKDSFHLDIVNMYSSSARQTFIRNCAALFDDENKIVENDMNRLINILENKKGELKKSGNVVSKLEVMTAREREEAVKFLNSPALFDEIVNDLSTLGYIGENVNKLAAYLAVTSRKMDDPLSIMISSRSAAGKPSLQEAVLSLLPPEDFVKYTSMTGKSLFYQDEFALQNKVLAIEEDTGSKEAGYSIRAIQSSKHLSIATTGRDGSTGKLKTEIYSVKGPVCVFFTTSSSKMDPETENRFLKLTIDESREQTKHILDRQRMLDTIEGLSQSEKSEKIIRKHQNAQRLLAPVKVINPFAASLTFTDETLRTRRDHRKYLTLIKTIAFLNQYGREKKNITIQGKDIQYIETTIEDIRQANELASVIFIQTLEELSPPSRALLASITEMVRNSVNGDGRKPEDVPFTRKNVRDHTLWGNYQLKTHIKELQDMEYLIPVSGGPRKRFFYRINSIDGDRKTTINLVNTDSLRRSGKLADLAADQILTARAAKCRN